MFIYTVFGVTMVIPSHGTASRPWNTSLMAYFFLASSKRRHGGQTI